MRYAYFCPKCKTNTIVEKKMALASQTEHCKECKEVLERIYTSTSIKTSDGIKGYF